MMLTPHDILTHFPITEPFKFVDEIMSLEDGLVTGAYTYPPDAFFFKGHFPGNPVVPGSILQETAAQIGLIPLGLQCLLQYHKTAAAFDKEQLLASKMDDLFYLVSSDLAFKSVVRPGERVIVYAEKIFFKLYKLKCNVRIETAAGQPVASGIMAGIVNIENILKQDIWRQE